MALIIHRRYGQSVVLTLENGDEVAIRITESTRTDAICSLHIDAEQHIAISRGEKRRPVDDRLIDELRVEGL